MASQKGKVLIFSAPSGSGKTTIVKRVLDAVENLEFSVSATTRPKRGEEVHGKDYYFLTVDEFKRKVAAGEFLEWEEVYGGRHYGTLLSEVERIRAAGNSAIFDVDVKGGINIKRHYGDEAISFFIQAPDLDSLRERLESRGTDSESDIEVRLAKAAHELTFRDRFDVVIVNQDLEEAVAEVISHIKSFVTHA